MRILSVLPLSFLLPIGANAGVLGNPKYLFDQSNNELCAVISDHGSRDGELLSRFEVNQAEKTMTVYTTSNAPEIQNSYQPPTADVMATVCQKCNLEPDNVNWVVFHNSQEPCIQSALKSYREPRWDEIREDEYINAIIVPDLEDDWHRFSQCTSFVSTEDMLTNSLIRYIHVVESENGCSLSYVLEPTVWDEEETDEHMQYSEFDTSSI